MECVSAPAFSIESKFVPGVYVLHSVVLLVSIYAQAGNWDFFILSRFLSAKVSGVSSYAKLFPEFASSHMVLITFNCRCCRF